MGGEDNLFLTPVIKLVQNDTYSQLQIVPDCGHVVNIEKPAVFNELSIEFIDQQKMA
jgi:pimeloyl-ACP methyl ester carboxylesterase